MEGERMLLFDNGAREEIPQEPAGLGLYVLDLKVVLDEHLFHEVVSADEGIKAPLDHHQRG